MSNLLLSRITKDYLNLDDTTPSKVRYRAGWSGSTLMSHPQKKGQKLLRQRAAYKKFKKRSSNLDTAPKLPPPKSTLEKESSPPWFFSRGDLDFTRRSNQEPHRYLLIETDEFANAKPVPSNQRLLRSICKGKGTLKKNQNGLFFLDVDNLFIEAIFPFLNQKKLTKPPYFQAFREPEGAHIPVIPSREANFQYMDTLLELGQTFTFEIEGLYSIKPAMWQEVEEVWFFKVKSEALENLRRRYFLPPHPNGHPFHIVVAVKKAVTTSPTYPIPSMRINGAILVA